MSAFSISSVAASGSSAQAPAQPGTPDATAAADTSPFALLLAALTTADPDLQTALPPNPIQVQAQPDTAQALPAPASAGQASGAAQASGATQTSGATEARLSAVNDDDADAATDIADAAADPTANAAQISVTDPDEITAPKVGKPDKKATADKQGADDTAGAPPVQMPVIVMPQPPIPPMAQAAVQTQAVASNDDSDAPVAAAIGARAAAAPAPPPQSGIVSGGKSIAPGPDTSQPISSQPSPPSQPGAKQAATQAVAQPLTPANDDGIDDNADLSDAIAALQTKTVAHGAGAKSEQVRNPSSKPASQAAPQPQVPAAPDDADADTAPSAGPSAAASAPAQTAIQTPQPALENMAAVSAAPQTPQKPATNASAKPGPDRIANAVPPQVNAAIGNVPASTNDPAQSTTPAPGVAADNDSGSKPAHAATSTAPQPQTDAPPPAQPPAAAAMPQAAVAINVAGTPAQGGPTLSVHVANHTPDTQSATPSAVMPNTDALAISVAARSLSGAKQFDIRLDPPELGRVDVRLSIDASGKTQAHMTTDQPQTLELLQKDAPNLTRALRDAGLDVSQNGLNFSLKGQGQNQGGQGGQFGTPSRSLSLPVTAQSIETAQPINSLSSLLGNARLDIHV